MLTVMFWDSLECAVPLWSDMIDLTFSQWVWLPLCPRFHGGTVAFAQMMGLKPNNKANSNSSLCARCALNFALQTYRGVGLSRLMWKEAASYERLPCRSLPWDRFSDLSNFRLIVLNERVPFGIACWEKICSVLILWQFLPQTSYYLCKFQVGTVLFRE